MFKLVVVGQRYFFPKRERGSKNKRLAVQSFALLFFTFQRPTEEKYNFTEKPHNNII